LPSDVYESENGSYFRYVKTDLPEDDIKKLSDAIGSKELVALTQIDGKNITKAIASKMEDELRRMDKRSSRLRGEV